MIYTSQCILIQRFVYLTKTYSSFFVRFPTNNVTNVSISAPIKRTGYSVEGGAPVIPMKVAQWRMKPKGLNFRLEKYPDLGHMEHTQ